MCIFTEIKMQAETNNGQRESRTGINVTTERYDKATLVERQGIYIIIGRYVKIKA
jgi:hypothetical protein